MSEVAVIVDRQLSGDPMLCPASEFSGTLRLVLSRTGPRTAERRWQDLLALYGSLRRSRYACLSGVIGCVLYPVRVGRRRHADTCPRRPASGCRSTTRRHLSGSSQPTKSMPRRHPGPPCTRPTGCRCVIHHNLGRTVPRSTCLILNAAVGVADRGVHRGALLRLPLGQGDLPLVFRMSTTPMVTSRVVGQRASALAGAGRDGYRVRALLLRSRARGSAMKRRMSGVVETKKHRGRHRTASTCRRCHHRDEGR